MTDMPSAPETPIRKPMRLAGFDYSQCGAYFITVCTHDRQPLLWDADETTRLLRMSHLLSDPNAFAAPLSSKGKAVCTALADISGVYGNISASPWSVMPDHFHLILNIFPDDHGLPIPSPSVSRVIQQLKRILSLRIGESIWQKSYHEHIVRNSDDYQQICKYIAENPLRWVIKRQGNG